MPEHFHLLIRPPERANPSRVVQNLKVRTAKFILSNLDANSESLWCKKMLKALTLPPTVNLHGPHRVWQGAIMI